MSLSKKLLLLTATIYPFIYLPIFMLWALDIIAFPGKSAIIPLHIAGMLSMIAIFIIYIRHITKNEKLKTSDQIFWVVMMLTLSPFAEIAYWYKYIWTDYPKSLNKMEKLENIPTKLESRILDWFIQNYPELTQQITKAKISSHEYSGCGFFLDFSIPKNIPPLSNQYKNTLDGPLIESKYLQHGGGSILFVKNGYISTLEIYTNANECPKNIEQFHLNTWEKLTL